MGRNEYSMLNKTLPKSGWHTITGTLARNIFNEIFWVGIPDSGSIIVDTDIQGCTIGYYKVKVTEKNNIRDYWNYYVFVGQTADGKIMSHEECESIMGLPVLDFNESNERYGERDGITKTKKHYGLDDLIISDEYVQKTQLEMDSEIKEEIERIKQHTRDKKIGLTKSIEDLKSKKKSFEVKKGNSIAEELKAEKQRTVLQKKLKKKEQQLFMEEMGLDIAMEEAINELMDYSAFSATVNREFIIKVKGKS